MILFARCVLCVNRMTGMKGDPLDLDSLVEPVYRNDIVSLHDRLAFNTNVREKREGIGRRPRTQDIRPLLT